MLNKYGLNDFIIISGLASCMDDSHTGGSGNGIPNSSTIWWWGGGAGGRQRLWFPNYLPRNFVAIL